VASGKPCWATTPDRRGAPGTHADCARLQERIEKRDAHNVAKRLEAGLNKSSARPLRAGFAKTILRLSFAPLQQRRRRSSTTLTCSNLNCPNF